MPAVGPADQRVAAAALGSALADSDSSVLSMLSTRRLTAAPCLSEAVLRSVGQDRGCLGQKC